MSIERISRNVGPVLENNLVPKINGEHQANSHGQGPEDDSQVPKIRNNVQEHLPDGKDVGENGISRLSGLVMMEDMPSQVARGPEDEGIAGNPIGDQVLRELDRNGDGVVSQSEAFKNASEYNIAESMFEGSEEAEGSDEFSIQA